MTAPGTRPEPRTRHEGRQRWRDLLFLHWPVPADAVRPAVPPDLPLDLRDGRAWVSLIALEVRGARPPLVPDPLGLDFLETNARTYVRRPGDEPAVYFFSLEAASRLAVLAARVRYGLPYFHAESSRREEGGAVLHRVSRRGDDAARLEVRYEVGAEAGTAPEGSLTEFLVERYVLHVQRGGEIRTVRVEHDPYPLRDARAEVVRETLLEAAGVPRPVQPPRVHFSPGVDVEIRVDR